MHNLDDSKPTSTLPTSAFAGDSAPEEPMQWWQLSRLAREDPEAAERGFSELAANEPANSGAFPFSHGSKL